MSIRNRVCRAAIHVALRKPAPDRFTTSLPGARGNDFYEVRLDDPDRAGHEALIRGRSGDNYTALYFNERSGGGHEATLLKKSVHQYGFRGRHYLHGYEFPYASPLRLAIDYYTGYNRFRITRDRLEQRLFNRRPLTRKHRIEVLKMFVEETTKNRDFRASHFRIIEAVHSRRSFSHPQRDETLNYYELLLDSMREDGHLRHEANLYYLRGAGMSALDRYIMEEKRHNQAISIQRTLAALTGALIFVGLLQALVTFVGS